MKKLIAILLMLALAIPLTANLTFADEISAEEEAEILRVAKEGLIVWDLFGGASFSRYYYDSEKFGYDEHTEFIKSLIDVETELYYVYGYGYTLNDGTNVDVFTERYHKAGYGIKNLDDLNSLVDKYYIGAITKFDDESMVGIYNGKLRRQPTVRTINGETYIMSPWITYVEYIPYNFNKFEVVDISGDTAIVTVVETTDMEDIIDYHNIELKRVNGVWKISGGDYFDGHWAYRSWFKNTPPATGENTVLYLAIACAAVAAMTAVALRRKREVVA